MAVDSKGFPHAAFAQLAKGGDLRYAEWDGSQWNITTVDSSENAKSNRGYDNSLVLGPDDSPHVSYLDGRTVKHAHQEKGNGSYKRLTRLRPASITMGVVRR